MLEDPRNNSLRTPAPKAPVTSALELAALSLLVLASHLATHIPNPGSAPSAWLAVNVIPSVPAALLIVPMAMNCGLINRVPSFPVAVMSLTRPRLGNHRSGIVRIGIRLLFEEPYKLSAIRRT
jgi:hypothetical protein